MTIRTNILEVRPVEAILVVAEGAATMYYIQIVYSPNKIMATLVVNSKHCTIVGVTRSLKDGYIQIKGLSTTDCAVIFEAIKPRLEGARI